MKLPSLPFRKKTQETDAPPGKPSTAGIFISYRRNDQAGFAGRLADQLEEAFGKEKIFRDVESIAPGENFVHALSKSLDSCSAQLIVIGPNWLEIGQDGKPRIFSKKDWVRAELEIALAKKKKMFPILVNGAEMPTANDLPKTLHKILEFNAHDVSDKRWDYDTGELIKELSNLPELTPSEYWTETNPGVGLINKLRRRGKLAVTAVGVFALLSVGAGGYIFLSGSQHCKDDYKERVGSYDARIENIRTLAGKEIKKRRLNDLSDSARSAASNLKSCCIFLDKEKINSDQYFECKNSADQYSSKLDGLVASLTEANENRIEQKTLLGLSSKAVIEDERLVVIEGKLDELLLVSRGLDENVLRLQDKESNSPSVTKVLSSSGEKSDKEAEIRLDAAYASTKEKISDDVKYYLYETQRDAKGKRKEVTSSKYSSTASFTVPPGKYHLWVGYGHASIESELEVRSGRTTQQTLVIPVGHIKLNAAYLETEEKIGDDVKYYLYETQRDAKGRRKEITSSKYSSTASFTVPPGKYHLWVGYGHASIESDLEVLSGKTTQQTLIIPVGHIKLNTAYLGTEEKIGDDVKYYLYETQRDARGRQKEITSSKYSSTASFSVPPGKYHLWVGYGHASIESELEVLSGKTTQQTLIIPVGHIKLNADYLETEKKIGDDVKYYLYGTQRDAKGRRKEIAHSKYSSTASFTVPPGKYHVKASFGNNSIESDIEVKSGEMTIKTISFPSIKENNDNQ